jgi:hypothetical protein
MKAGRINNIPYHGYGILFANKLAYADFMEEYDGTE